MTKQELITKMAAELGISKKQCTLSLNTMIEEISRTLEVGGKFTQQGFGSFKTTDTNERTGRNPSTGQKMLYPKKRRLRFKASETFKDEINE